MKKPFLYSILQLPSILLFQCALSNYLEELLSTKCTIYAGRTHMRVVKTEKPKTRAHLLGSVVAIKSFCNGSNEPHEKCLQKRRLYSQQ